MLKQMMCVAGVCALAACQQQEATPSGAILPAASAVVEATGTAASAVVPTLPAASAPAAMPVETSKPTKPKAEAPKAAPTSPVATAAPLVEKPLPPVAEKPAPQVAPPVVSASVEPPAAKPAPSVPTQPIAEAKPATMSDADAMALAKKRNCFACHQVASKVVGPAWKDVAAKYRGDAGAQARLETKMAKGGSGVWGNMAMPAQPQLTADERAQLVRFILNLK